MFFLKNKKIKNNYFLFIYISTNNRYFFWRFFFLGFFFDEIFSNILKTLNKNFFSIPGIYFFDKYFSYWLSYNFLKKKFFFFSNYFFLEKINYNFFILYLLLFIFFYMIFFFFFF